MANGMYYICIALYSPFLSAFFSSRGMSAGQIGILAAVAPVASLLIQPIWARISDRSGKRRIVIQILEQPLWQRIGDLLPRHDMDADFCLRQGFIIDR